MSNNDKGCGEGCKKPDSSLIEIAFKGNRRGWYKNRRELVINKGEKVVVDAERGLEVGTVISTKSSCCATGKLENVKDIRRTATEEDIARELKGLEKEKNAFRIASERIFDYGLQMKLVDVEYQFDGNKMTFFFTAEHRVDFRELVKSLAGIYRTRIELRQIGVRDEAKRIDGVGVCGRPQCCSSFMDGFYQVTTQLAKDQQLSLNPSKISGNCGRLLCCLQFEEEDYLEAYKILPRAGCTFTNSNGKLGDIVFVDTFKNKIQVRRFEEGMNKFEWYELDDIEKGEVGEAPEYRRR